MISTLSRALSDHFYRRTARLAEPGERNDRQRIEALRRLLLEIYERATEPDRLHFSTSFARISYAAHKFGLSRQLTYQDRRFRRVRAASLPEERLAAHLATGLRVSTELIAALFGTEPPPALQPLLRAPYPDHYRRPEVQARFYQLRVLVTAIDEDAGHLRVREERRPELAYVIPYTDPELAESPVAQAVDIVRRVSGPFVVLNLIGAELRNADRLYPTQIVIEPDFLVNVTDVAGCFASGPHYQPWTSLPKRLLPFEKRPPLVRGNIVNSFLDLLIHRPALTFAEVLPGIFALQPLEICLFTDREVRQLVEELKHHFLTVQKFVREEMPKLDIDREAVMLEPTFLSPAFGLQGRLDLLQSQRDTEEGMTSIVELKTSKIFAPNVHGIRSDNFIQTLLYDLMINQALGAGANVRSYILYSVDYAKPVRYAPPEFTRQMEAIAARNQLVAIEMMLAQLGGADAGAGPTPDLAAATDRLFARIDPVRLGRLGKFTERDHRTVQASYDRLTDAERRYFGAFLGFVAREQRLAKIGDQRSERINGLASLWLDERQDKIDRFELLDGLRFDHYDAAENVLTLRRSAESSDLVKFRQGDIIALYATPGVHARPEDTVSSQIFKSTIVAVGPQTLHLRPRSPQLNDSVFRRSEFWSVEKDVLDSSFRNHYLGLYRWATASPELRQRWLGLIPPGRAAAHPDRISDTLTDEQDAILRKILTAPDYFLLWGPPGTGKTSQMLHHLVAHLLARTEENILLIAYTNRAVDEICESIERIRDAAGRPFRDYLRIGSRYGADERFADRLLQLRSAGVRNRQELRGLIENCRVVVGTVASVGGKDELFQLKRFDRIVVDEASQILEPLLAGLLPRAPRCLLIGDHRQLPAVVQQDASATRVADARLREIGLTNLATSLFERLFLTARARGWDWAYDQLRHQGRMHRDIMAFPARDFYNGRLDILPTSISHHLRQVAPLALRPDATDELQPLLAGRRLLFLPAPADHGTVDPKVNRHEAAMLLRLIRSFHALYAATERPIVSGDIGIITPYRAQIAHVREVLLTADLSPDAYTVDTVERYQGSAKRIILMSLCANEEHQLASLSQLSEEGVDRKLNVAMTRAREHLVLVGCPEVLGKSEVYGRLLAFLADGHSGRGT